MAATRLIPLHENKGKTVSRCLKDRVEYAKNGEKTEQGEFVTAYECNSEIVDEEFYSTRNEYLKNHRAVKGDVIGYQIRQSFKPGEISPEEANAIGYELAKEFTKGKHAFIVATHTDKAHIHNHIIFNSVDLEGERKFKNFFLSALVIQKISDRLCIEHGLSVIQPKPYRERKKRTDFPSMHRKDDKKIDLLIDIQEKIAQGKGPGYENWAKVHNIKQVAKSLLFLEEHNIRDLETLSKLTSESSEKFGELTTTIKDSEKRMEEIVDLKKHILNYSKTRDVYEAYRKAGYSKKFLEAHREEITIHKAAKQAFDNLGLKKIPTFKELNAEYGVLLEKKRAAYKEYRQAKQEMSDYATAKYNLEKFLNLQKEEEIKNQEKAKKQEKKR